MLLDILLCIRQPLGQCLAHDVETRSDTHTGASQVLTTGLLRDDACGTSCEERELVLAECLRCDSHFQVLKRR